MAPFDLLSRQSVKAGRQAVFADVTDVVHRMVEGKAGILAVRAPQGQNIQIRVITDFLSIVRIRP